MKIVNEKSHSRFTWKKFFGHFIIALALFHVDMYYNTVALAQENESSVIDKQQLANQNLKENMAHEENTLLANSSTSCQKSTSSTTDRRNAENKLKNNLIDQSFNEIDGVFTDVENARRSLNGEKDQLVQSIYGVNGEGQANNLNKKKELEDERARVLATIPPQEQRVAAKEQELNRCDDYDGRVNRRCENYDRIAAELQVERQKLNQLQLRERQLKGEIYDTTVRKGASAVSAANSAVDKSNQVAGNAEQKLNRMLALIKAQENRMEAAMNSAMLRLKQVELQEKHNAEFKIYEKAMAEFDERTARGRRAISNLEVMAMASAALKLLSCSDISDIKTRSYPLLKAASANFIASTINDTEAYTEVTKGCIMQCESIDVIKEDQKAGSPRYPQYAKKDFSNTLSNCKTGDGSDGLLINETNADEDKNEQIKSIERAANLHNQLVKSGELLIANRTDSIDMFQAAHAAAMMELTTKTTRIATAEAQLKQAKAWREKAKKSILIYLGIIAALWATNVMGSNSAAIAAAIVILKWHRNDKKKAEKKIAKWEKKLEEARIHGLMACNYPGDDAGLNASESPLSFPHMHRKSVIQQRTTVDVNFEKNEMYGPKESITNNLEKSDFIKGEQVSLFATAANAFGDFLFPNVIAVSGGESLGMHSEASSFKNYMVMRVGAWKLLSYNAAFLVNLRAPMVNIDNLHPKITPGVTLKEYINRNKTSFGGKTIERTGFALPETRVVLLATILEMIGNNLTELDTGLAAATDMRDQYVTLLNKMRGAMELGTTGHEDDVTKKEKTKTGICIKKNNSGEYTFDHTCDCKANNSCANFKSPKFANFVPGAVEQSAAMSEKKASALANGNIEEANLIAGEMRKNSSAVRDFIDKEENKINKVKKKYGQKPGNLKEEARYVVTAKRDKFISDLSKDNPKLSSVNRNSFFPNFGNLNKNANAIKEDGDKKSGDENANDQKVVSLRGKAGKKNTGKKKSAINLGLSSIKIEGGDGPGLGDLDLGSIRNENNYEGHKRRKSGNEYAEGYSNSESFVGADGTEWKHSQGISRDTSSTLFKIISRRYKKSALPVLVRKKRR